MKKLYLIFIYFVINSVNGQFNQNMYDVGRNIYSLKLNPGMKFEEGFNYDKWFVLPGFNVNTFVHSTGFTAYSLLNKKETLIESIYKYSQTRSKNDFIGFGANISILEVGFSWRNKDKKTNYYFWGGIDVSSFGHIFFPQQLANFFGKGYSYETFVDLSELKGEASLYTSYYFGINYNKDNSPFTFGGKIKVYNSIASINTENNSYIQTTPNHQSNIDIIFTNDLYYRTSGFMNRKLGVSDFFFSGNMGLGIDLGFTYQEENIRLTASVLDLGGFIYNSKDTKTDNYKYQTLYGGEYLSNIIDYKDINNFITQVKDNFKKKDTLVESFVTSVPTIFNIGFTYTFFGQNIFERIPGSDCKNCDHITKSHIIKYNVGIQLTSILRNYNLYSGATLFFHHQKTSNFDYKFTYTIEKYNYYNLGLYLGYRGFYISAENLLGYMDLLKSNAQSISLGWALSF